MLRITIELYPYGLVARKRTLGIIDIANDGTGTKTRGNYMVRIQRGERKMGNWIKGAIKDFPRKSKGAFDLLLLALISAVNGKKVIDKLKEEE